MEHLIPLEFISNSTNLQHDSQSWLTSAHSLQASYSHCLLSSCLSRSVSVQSECHQDVHDDFIFIHQHNLNMISMDLREKTTQEN